MNLKLTKEHYQELIKKGLSLDYVFMLMLIKEGHGATSIIGDSMKLEAIYQTLHRKALLTDDDKITIIGQELLDFMNSKIVTTIVRNKPSTKEFDLWWEAFPRTDEFEYKGRVFLGSRGMRVQKEKCKLKFNSIINEGKYSAQQIIDATNYVVNMKKEASFRKKSNELTYLKNSLSFLNEEESYVPFIGKEIPTETASQPSGGGIDI